MIVGQQAGSLGVPQKVHTQKSTGKAVSASMDAFDKLMKARAESTPKAAGPREVLGTLSHEDATELAAGLDLRMDALANRIDQGKATLEAIKESQDPAVAKLTGLIPVTKEGKGEITHITIGQYQKVWGRQPKPEILTKDKRRVRWEYALDEIAQQLHLEPLAQAAGKAPDEYLKGLVEDARETKALIAATESELASDEATLKSLEKLKGNIRDRVATTTTGPFLHKLAHPKIKTATKPKPETRARVMAAGVAKDLIAKIQAKRTARAILIDNSLLAGNVVPVSKVELWASHPNRIDIRGVDTPGHGKVTIGVGYADRGRTRLSRSHHKGFSRLKLT